MQTFKAYVAYDTPITCHLRDDAGRQDLSALTLTVEVRKYGHAFVLKTLSASGDATGDATFTVPKNLGISSPTDPYDYTDSGSLAGLYRFDIVSNGESIYRGILELV